VHQVMLSKGRMEWHSRRGASGNAVEEVLQVMLSKGRIYNAQ